MKEDAWMTKYQRDYDEAEALEQLRQDVHSRIKSQAEMSISGKGHGVIGLADGWVDWLDEFNVMMQDETVSEAFYALMSSKEGRAFVKTFAEQLADDHADNMVEYILESLK